MLFFMARGYRVIAHDRRGHGRSLRRLAAGTIWTITPTTWRRLRRTFDLKNAIHVGHSTGGGEVTRTCGQHGESRVAKAALISAVPPLMLKTRPIRWGFQRKCSMICRRKRASWPQFYGRAGGAFLWLQPAGCEAI